MLSRKIALFGGTFDPVHIGHTIVAAKAVEQIDVEEIVFIPAKCSVLKDSLPQASDTDRLAMMALAIADNKKFRVSDCELKKSEPSYSLETVRQFQADYGSETSLYWLVGVDAVDDLPLWYRVVELIDECNLCVMYRAGFSCPDFAKYTAIWGPSRVEKLQQNVIKTPLIDISSTNIRDRLIAGGDVTDMLHPKVADYIRKQGLYQSEKPRAEN